MGRYGKNIFFALLLWLLMPLVIYFPRFVIDGVLFRALCEWFPSVFVNYSPVSEPEAYAVLSAILDIAVASAAILIISYISVRYDNERMEYMISKTEGLYSLKDGSKLYFPRYFLADVAVSLAVVLPFVIASAFVPEHVHKFVDPVFDYLFSFVRIYTSHLGIALGAFVLCLSLLVGRTLSGLRSLKAWQGIWLSEVE
jgi:hypothetical protein